MRINTFIVSARCCIGFKCQGVVVRKCEKSISANLPKIMNEARARARMIIDGQHFMMQQKTVFKVWPSRLMCFNEWDDLKGRFVRVIWLATTISTRTLSNLHSDRSHFNQQLTLISNRWWELQKMISFCICQNMATTLNYVVWLSSRNICRKLDFHFY